MSSFKDAEYISLEEASDRLGKGYSRSSILRRIDSGEWQEGLHWIDDRRNGTAYRRIKINFAAVQQWRQIPAAKRAPAEVGGDRRATSRRRMPSGESRA